MSGGGNPNHDEKGRFTDGPSSGSPAPSGTGKTFTAEQKSHLNEYASNGYAFVNRLLRGEGGDSDDFDVDEYDAEEVAFQRSRIKAIDTAIANNVIGAGTLHGAVATDSDLELHRGTKLAAFGLSDIDDVKIGGTLQNHAFVSTSRSSRVADRFASKGGIKPNEAAVLVIKTTPKSRGADISSFGMLGENEVILGRKSKFRVDKIVKRDSSRAGMNVIYVTHIDPH